MKNKNINLEDILTDRAVEEDLIEIPLTSRVFGAFSFLILISGIIILSQLINIGIGKHAFYEARALDNISEVKIEPVPRGIINDRFGKPMVVNEQTLNVFLVPRLLPQSLEEKAKVLSQISEILEIDIEELNKKIAEKDWNLNDRLFLTKDLNHDQLITLSSAVISGLEIEPSFKRVHASPLKASHLIGYTGLVNKGDLERNSELVIDDEIGRVGIEAIYDQYLRGINGKEIIFRDARGEKEDERIVQSSTPGKKLKTFVDLEFQDFFYDRLKEALTNLGQDIGAGIAINPRNGEVLALVSIPSFDSTKVAKFLNMPDQPLFNRTISGLYTPGSTIKPLVATAALKEGIIVPEKQIYSAGFIELPNPYNPEKPNRFVDWKAHGWVNLWAALAKSSNVYFYEIGGGFKDQKGLGISKLNAWWQKFALNEKTKIDLIGEESGFLPDPEWKEKTTQKPWLLGDTYNVTIGQGDLLVTPIQILNYISAIANGGKIYKPRIMQSILDENNQVILQSEPSILKDLGAEIQSYLPDVKKGMRDAVNESYGTAHYLANLPLQVAAKTGSAQVENNKKLNAFFVGYAPYENPEIAILVLVENAKEGSLNTVPVARDIFMWYYQNRIKDKKTSSN